MESFRLEIDPFGVRDLEVCVDFFVVTDGGDCFASTHGVFVLVFDVVYFESEFSVKGCFVF